MGQISSEVEKVKWEAGSVLNNLKNNASDAFDAVVGKGESAVGAVLKYDVVGINAEKVPDMQKAIREYVANLDKHLAEVNQNADTAQAFSGKYATGVKKFVAGVTAACGAVISMLLAFNDQLEEVKAAYEKKDETVNSDLEKQTGELESNFKRYTEGSK